MVALALTLNSTPVTRATVMRFTVGPPPGQGFSPTSPPAVSPDGTRVAFVAVDSGGKASLWLRVLDATASAPLTGTEGAAQPFWASDSRAVAFFADGKLKKLPLAGGLPQTVCDAPSPRGGTWVKTMSSCSRRAYN